MANTRINFLSPRSDASLDPPRYLREINSRYNISPNFPDRNSSNSQNTQRRRPIRERLKRRNRNWRLRPREKASNIPTAPSSSSSSSFPSSSSLLFLFLFSPKKIPTIVRPVPGNLFSAKKRNFPKNFLLCTQTERNSFSKCNSPEMGNNSNEGKNRGSLSE